MSLVSHTLCSDKGKPKMMPWQHLQKNKLFWVKTRYKSKREDFNERKEKQT